MSEPYSPVYLAGDSGCPMALDCHRIQLLTWQDYHNLLLPQRTDRVILDDYEIKCQYPPWILAARVCESICIYRVILIVLYRGLRLYRS